MVIKLVCPGCKSAMSAPDTYLGKRGKCPKCGTIITIQPQETPPPHSAQIVVDDLPTLIQTEGVPRRIAFSNIYVILNNERLLAYWKRGEGWQYQTSHGFVPVRSAESLIPEQGEFVLAEGNVKETDEGHRLVGAQFFKIAGGGGLKPLLRSESEIFEKIVGRVPLGMTQKRQFLLFIRDHYFQSFTERAGDLIEYLTNEDFHSVRIGDTESEDSEGLPQEG
ncbi:MAG: hypothetical protein IJG60_08115 [Thermoguttaceae bacterium]|nr:hypothetical protein [Thermoguttaceae bacterium]